jgi:hypothetical protein
MMRFRLKLTQRLAPLPVGVGVNQIVEGFGFGEIELAVLKCAAGEFARLRRPDMFKLRERGEQRRLHRTAAVNVKLGYVFSGRACGSRKPEHDRIIDPLPFPITQQGSHCHPGLRHPARQGLKRRPGLRTRHPNDRNRARRPAR